jgi:3-oxoacyl-[acyl-carrier protein] reductase
MDLGIEGRIALVCGASRGIGEACARALAGEGVRTIVLARTRERIEEVVQGIRQSGGTASPLVADLSNIPNLGQTALGAASLFGHIDILVNNTGGPPTGGNLAFSSADWEEAFRATFLSACELTRHLIEGMAQRGWGRIINLTSITVMQPLEGLILSNSIRMAVIGWAKTLSEQFAVRGVTVNNVATGFTLTDRVRDIVRRAAEQGHLGEEEVTERMVREIPMGRMAAPGEIAQLVLFLAGRGADYITGATIPVDGGFHAAAL